MSSPRRIADRIFRIDAKRREMSGRNAMRNLIESQPIRYSHGKTKWFYEIYEKKRNRNSIEFRSACCCRSSSHFEFRFMARRLFACYCRTKKRIIARVLRLFFFFIYLFCCRFGVFGYFHFRLWHASVCLIRSHRRNGKQSKCKFSCDDLLRTFDREFAWIVVWIEEARRKQTNARTEQKMRQCAHARDGWLTQWLIGGPWERTIRISESAFHGRINGRNGPIFPFQWNKLLFLFFNGNNSVGSGIGGDGGGLAFVSFAYCLLFNNSMEKFYWWN